MYYVYILQSQKNKRLYTGSTNNLKRRIEEHNSGTSKYTRLSRPWQLIHSEIFSTRASAYKRELFLKTGQGREWIQTTILKHKGG